ncbi:haloacid dehalogenase [Sphingomonas sp. Leaf17]|uniref:HAD family hydrolase n=1 Tax=Sphingomonas sp. Leaf17 TaxID=1735683 RepID=UPI0006F430AD|nr:HAD family hydrolase [Sphingomonas sp. Leaf17]KQM67881.1 haloacid dehalogenase [Sphingomonas sp. Leaf17]
MREPIAIYDMDKTITRGATWTPFLLHATRRGPSPWRLALWPIAGIAAAGYAARIIDRGRLKQATHRLMLGGRLHERDARAAAAGFADRILKSGVLAGALAQISADRASGHRLVMATASYRFYAQAIAERLGFDAVIGTEIVSDSAGHVLARIDGENCYGAGKLRMIEAWMRTQGLTRDAVSIRFYSDHVSDAPVLDWADEPFAVNAHGPLRVMAAARGWPVLDWR